jgi:predicted Holliday junction resolvase-like endonuclease
MLELKSSRVRSSEVKIKGDRTSSPIDTDCLMRSLDCLIAELERSQAVLERAYEQQARRDAEAIALQERLAKQEAEAIAEQERNEKLEERLAKQESDAIAERERLIALQERNKNEKLAAYLRSLGINPDDI